MSKPQPKFPDNLAILERADLESSAADRQKIFPIMSVSKSFFGATCALMAVDGKFGEKGIDATLYEVLERAKSQHSDRREKIEAYQQLLRDKDFADVTIAEMLSHRSGFHDAYEVEAGLYAGHSRLEFFNEKMDRREFKRGEFHYSNEGFMLMEEILNLVSKEGYEVELQNRILKPLKLDRTGLLYNSKEALERVSESVELEGSENRVRGIVISTTTKIPGQNLGPDGKIPISAGALCSTVNDLEKYSQELVKMVCGQESLLTGGKSEPKMLEIYHRGEFIDGPKEFYANGLSMSENESGKLTIRHGGGLPGNSSLMKITMSCQFVDFKEGKADLLAAAQIEEKEIFVQKEDCVVRNRLANGHENFAVKFLRDYFDGKLNDNERARFRHAPLIAHEEFLIKEKRLPENFPEVRKKIFAAFDPVKEEVSKYLQNEFINADGIIDSAKIAETFKKEDDILRVFREVPKVREALEQAQKKTEELLPTQEKSASVAASASSSESFVERLQEARQRADSKSSSQGR